jgi:hypothetical protein
MSIGAVTGLLDCKTDFDSLQYEKKRSVPQNFQTRSETQPFIQWVPGTRSLGMKRPEYEADHPTASITEVKRQLKYMSALSYAVIARTGQLYLLK